MSEMEPSWMALDRLEQAAECLRVLAHPHRLRMVEMLLKDRYSVGELAQACDIPSHMASEHLMLMKRCGFLKCQSRAETCFIPSRNSLKQHHGMHSVPLWGRSLIRSS